ncbi:hypothetical protein [Yinghuangia soli]|uniref:Uncharacterized protein n=1 Tax=Yinghuangia soli TaxID=2908204 RepID=A0AA41Q8Q2_9ACTN|nr:hypothetical protein [Yinghuangia soli]MCF2533659.1 hypothetical protein [Yinghuangia soli]
MTATENPEYTERAENTENTEGSRRPGRRARTVLVTLAALSVLATGTMWGIDLSAEARFGQDLCHGILRTGEVRDLGPQSRITERVYRAPAPGSPETECAAGPIIVTAYPLPQAHEVAEYRTQLMGAGQAPLGPGLEGSADSDRAWLLLPCPAVAPGVPVFVSVAGNESVPGRGEAGRDTRAKWVVRAARYVNEQAGCGAPAIPDAALPHGTAPAGQADAETDRIVRNHWRLWARSLEPVGTGPLCGLIPQEALPARLRASAALHAGSLDSSTAYGCEVFDDDFNALVRLTVVRGPVAGYLRTPGNDASVNPTSAHPWLFLDCAGRQAIFDLFDANADLAPADSVKLISDFAAAYRNSPACKSA